MCVQNPSPPAGPGGGLDPHRRGQRGLGPALGLFAAQPGVGSDAPLSPRSRRAELEQAHSQAAPGAEVRPSTNATPGCRDRAPARGPTTGCTGPSVPREGPSSGRRRCWRGGWAGRGGQGRVLCLPGLSLSSSRPPQGPYVSSRHPTVTEGAEASHHPLPCRRPPSRRGQTVSQRFAGCEVSSTPGTLHCDGTPESGTGQQCGGGTGWTQSRTAL